MIYFKFQLILKLDSFYFFSTENQFFVAEWVLRRNRQLDSVWSIYCNHSVSRSFNLSNDCTSLSVAQMNTSLC